MAEDTSEERTEEATDKRMKEVREKGQLQRSQDMTAWVGVGAAAVMFPLTIERAAAAGTDQLFSVRQAAAAPSPELALELLGQALASIGATIGPLLGVTVAAVLAAAALQGGIRFKKFKGKFEQFDPVKGMKNTFGTQALWNGAKALLKTVVVGLVLYTVIQRMVPVLMTAGGLPVSELLAAAGGGVGSLIQFAVAAGVILALADVLVVRKRNRKKTRMTRKEVKDENKSTDGDPLIKSQRRARQLAMSRNRMISAVGSSDVVMVNPTHIAVALKYEPGKSAPRVVAKGAGVIASKIRERAEAEKVPIVRDVPLARALHAQCDVGQEIPPDLFAAVAGVLAFVLSLKRRGTVGGFHAPAVPDGTYLAS